LAGAIPGTQGNQRHIPGSSPPLNLDAVDLKNDIDSKLTQWQLSKQHWRPQDTELIDTYTADIHLWCKRIDALLNPVHTKQISAACPHCEHTHVYRHNSSGESVRTAALQIVAEVGCQCLHCHATWTPDRYLLLCRVLGFDVPTGVLE
jgi:phage terminase large subunit GpA-like protein